MLIYLDESDVEVLEKFAKTSYYGFEEYQILQKIINQIQEQKLSHVAKLTCEEDS